MIFIILTVLSPSPLPYDWNFTTVYFYIFLYFKWFIFISIYTVWSGSNQNINVCTTLGVQQAQPSFDCGKSNFLIVDVQGLSSVYSAPVVDCMVIYQRLYNVGCTTGPTFFRLWKSNFLTVNVQSPLSL